MLEKIEIFNMAQALAKHSAARQSVIAQNVANADTPGYRARDVASFSDTFQTGFTSPMRATRAGHALLGEASNPTLEARAVYRPDAASPNGNNVSIESEMFAAAEAKGQHDRALAIYTSAMKILRTSVSGRS